MAKEPTLKMKTALMDYILNPTVPITHIAERNSVKYAALRKAIQRNRDWIDEQSMQIWKEKKIMAMRMAEKLAERGSWKAIEFLLRSNQINPEQRITNTEQEIHITLENKDD